MKKLRKDLGKSLLLPIIIIIVLLVIGGCFYYFSIIHVPPNYSVVAYKISDNSKDFIQLPLNNSDTAPDIQIFSDASLKKQMVFYKTEDTFINKEAIQDLDQHMSIEDTSTGQICNVYDYPAYELYLSKDGKVVLILSSAASDEELDIIDTHTCKPITDTLGITGTTDGSFSLHRLEFIPTCEPVGDANSEETDPEKVVPNVKVCTSAQVWNLDNNYQPTFNQTTADEITQETIGVTFQGWKVIDNPNTTHASIDPHPENYALPN